MKAFRTSDKVTIHVGDVQFKVSPLSFEHRTIVQSEILNAERNSDPLGLVRAARLAMKYAVKEQKGITYHDDSDFDMKFDGNGDLSDECLDELLLADSDDKLKLICMTMSKGFPTIPVDDKGKPIKGITIDKMENTPGKK